jgi:hypothetical protein
MRSDSLAQRVDELRLKPHDDPAKVLYDMGVDHLTGSEVARVYGFLIHYTLSIHLERILESEIGLRGKGLYLSPTPYAGCVAPYNLGLTTGRDAWIVVDVSTVPKLWGPGRAGVGSVPWRGGGIEFFSPVPLDKSTVVTYGTLSTCGEF